MKSKPSIDDFLQSGAADAENRVADLPVSPRIHRDQKVFRLPLDVIKALKNYAHDLSMETDTRITEQLIVEQALRAYMKM